METWQWILLGISWYCQGLSGAIYMHVKIEELDLRVFDLWIIFLMALLGGMLWIAIIIVEGWNYAEKRYSFMRQNKVLLKKFQPKGVKND